MEYVIVSHIMKHLELNNILTDMQFGLAPTIHVKSSYVLITIDDLVRALNNKLQINCGFYKNIWQGAPFEASTETRV